MSEFIIKKASKKAKKLRILLSASSGSGKTYGALLIAKGLVKNWSKVCVIDTERDSASLYADFGEYNTLNLQKPYTPERYIEAITYAEQAGMEVIIVDSITHEWNGPGGCLEIQADLGGKFQDWAKVTPRHNAFVDKLLTSSAHIICTVRRKEEFSMEKSATGKTEVVKMGLQEVTRDGFNYEMDLVFEISNDNHLAKTTKDRTELFTGKPEFLITEETGTILNEWANNGRSLLDDAMDLIRTAKTVDTLNNIRLEYVSLQSNDDFMTALKKKRSEIQEQTK